MSAKLRIMLHVGQRVRIVGLGSADGTEGVVVSSIGKNENDQISDDGYWAIELENGHRRDVQRRHLVRCRVGR